GGPSDADGIPVEVSIVDKPGVLTLTVGDYGDGVELTQDGDRPDRWRYSGDLPTLTVTDSRNVHQAGNGGWAVSGQSSDFASDAGEITADHLGWVPRVLTPRAGVSAGDASVTALDGGTGLSTPSRLAAADADGRRGTTELDAKLVLGSPVGTAEGDYSARVTVSLFPVDGHRHSRTDRRQAGGLRPTRLPPAPWNAARMPVLRLLRLLVAAAFVVGALPASAALATTGGEDVAAGTTWALEPATDDDAAGRVSIRHEIEPGESVSDAVVVSNLSAHDATFAVYAGDGLVDDEGNFDTLPAETAPSDGGAWVEIGEVEGATPRPGGGIVVEVPASSSTRVPLEITVPAD